jgi:hypothetical protein
MKVGVKLLVIQPWFTALGHPAQSLLNMACAIGKDERVDYLVSCSEGSGFCQDALERLQQWGEVENFAVTTPTGPSNTMRALQALWRIRGRGYPRILFFDGSMFPLALLWPLLSRRLAAERLCILHLFGPRMGRRNWLERRMVGRLLLRPEVRLYLRTEELAAAWRDTYSLVPHERIAYLPSLEIPDEDQRRPPRAQTDTLAFGIIGQIRVGKGIEWLVPAFSGDGAPGRLTVAGEYASAKSRDQLKVLQEYPGYLNGFLTEEGLLEHAAAQDYLLMLYDEWDRRMESAVLYLAARVDRPVIVYGDSWCSRMVREFGCGAVAPEQRDQTLELLRVLPRPGSAEYAALLEGMDRFRRAHSASSLRGRVIRELLG